MQKYSEKDFERVYNSAIQKEGFFSVFIYRKISIKITKFISRFDISPNQITIFSFILVLIAAAFFAVGKYYYNIAGIILFNIHMILDLCDGEAALLKNKKTVLGAWLDSTLDRTRDLILYFSLVYGSYVLKADASIWPLFLLMLATSNLCSSFDSINKSLNINSSNERLKSGINHLFKKSKFNSSYIRWDGGFSAVLISLCVLFNQIDFLMLFLALFSLLCIVANFSFAFNKFKR